MKYDMTTAQIWIRRLSIIVVACVVAAVCIVGYGLYEGVQKSMSEQAEASVKNAIVNAANQCFAIEGSYPPSIKHLEESYGLVTNSDDYYITYETFADNVAPNVMVKAK